MKYELNQQERSWLQEMYEKIRCKLDAECSRVGGRIPYMTEDDVYKEDKARTDIIWWTNGFWAGMLWQLYHAEGKPEYRKAAEEVEQKLDRALDIYTGLHHDVGFMWLHTAVADFRLTGSERSKARGLHAAHLLAGRYNPNGRFLRSWNRDRAGWVIVDSLLNVPLLYWATNTIDDPRFRTMAENHVDTLLRYTVRPDGSCNHIIVLDPMTGELLDTPGGQGYASGSSWSRGQTWALYGLALSARHTGREDYLFAAKRVAHYFLACVAETDYLPLVDFRAPAEPVYWDATAGACAACGLLEIARQVSELERALYVHGALKLLHALDTRCCDWDETRDGIVAMGSGSYFTEHDRHAKIIYGDYFLLEAVLRLLDRDVLLW